VITSILKRMQPNRPHLALLVVLLLCSVVLSVVLAWQGYDASRNQRAQAEGMLSDWAAIALDTWHERVQTTLFTSTYHALGPGVAAGDEDGGRRLDRFASGIEIHALCGCIDSRDMRTFFVFDLADRRIETKGSPLSPVVREWITRGISQENGVVAGEDLTVGMLVGAPDGASRVVFYAVRLNAAGEPVTAYGVETGAETLSRMLDILWRVESVLLPSVSRGMPNDWLLSATVKDRTGRVLYQSGGRYPQQYAARAPMDRILRDVEATVAVRPDLAGQFLIGGLPSSRLPVLFGLLALTAGLLVVALFLIRREAEITRLRADFIAGVSHELRTPLAQIRMFAETLMLGRVRSDSEKQRSLEIIDQEARRLTHMVENVLLFARAERRSSRINPEPLDLAVDIRDAIHGFAILCRSKAVEIRPELQDGVTAPVDRGALRQVLLNLLDNAAKYGPLAQRITVGMALFDRSVRIWVDDEGRGIPEADRSHVFESFFRLERDIASPVAGSGIGLAIVRELVHLHHGRAWIDDAPGGGARVVVEFPGAYLRADAAKDEWAVA
jgi:signal transduction histidine kinase